MSHDLYNGPSGRTRVERVRVFRAGRQPKEVEVFRAVNVAEHPELRAPALGGTLHRLDDGDIIAVPFVYHDPGARQLVLVIPDGARGREPSERAKLLDSLSEEREDQVPDYARHFVVVHGSDELRCHVEDSETIEVDANELEPVYERPVHPIDHHRPAALLPAARCWAQASTDLVTLIDDEELWIFVQVGADDHEAFSEVSSELLIEMKSTDELPTCIVTLSDARTQAIRRAVLDLGRSEDRRLLELLRCNFHATVVVYSDRCLLVRSFRIEVPRAGTSTGPERSCTIDHSR